MEWAECKIAEGARAWVRMGMGRSPGVDHQAPASTTPPPFPCCRSPQLPLLHEGLPAQVPGQNKSEAGVLMNDIVEKKKRAWAFYTHRQRSCSLPMWAVRRQRKFLLCGPSFAPPGPFAPWPLTPSRPLTLSPHPPSPPLDPSRPLSPPSRPLSTPLPPKPAGLQPRHALARPRAAGRGPLLRLRPLRAPARPALPAPGRGRRGAVQGDGPLHRHLPRAAAPARVGQRAPQVGRGGVGGWGEGEGGGEGAWRGAWEERREVRRAVWRVVWGATCGVEGRTHTDIHARSCLSHPLSPVLLPLPLPLPLSRPPPPNQGPAGREQGPADAHGPPRPLQVPAARGRTGGGGRVVVGLQV